MHPVLVGFAAALRAPLYLGRARLAPLLDAGAVGPDTTVSPDAGRSSERAIRAGSVALRHLARLRLPLWRNTCLFRAIVACLVLRRYGRPVVLRIGVRREQSGSGAIAAHAWVEPVSSPDVAEAVRYRTLRVVARGA